MKKKVKAQVSLIAVILIVLIVIVAFLIIWNIVVPLLEEKSEEAELSGFTTSLEVKEAVLFETGTLWVTVNRKAGKGYIKELKFVFYDEQEQSRVETVEEGIGELETKTYHFSPISGLGKIEKVSVVPGFEKTTGREFKTETDKILKIPSGLVSWWKFEKNLNDEMGNNPGVSFGNVKTDAGFLELDGVSYVGCGNGSSLDIINKMAISFWIKPSLNQGSIVKKGMNYEVSLVDGKISFSYGSQQGSSSGWDNLLDGNWHHIVINEDWTGNKEATIYINGGLDNTISMPNSPDTNSEQVKIGENFNGAIDELMFFDRSLALSQAEGLYNGQKSTFS